MKTRLKDYLERNRVLVDRALEKVFPEPEGYLTDILRAMRYSLFAGGKRLRPILCLSGARAVGGEDRTVLPVACALELIHTYSLVHDDLPVMDDDDLRRGKPTSHKVFGEAVALLAGDGLLTEAFRLMTGPFLTEGPGSSAGMRVIALISQAAGYQGMVGGQAVDIRSEGREVEPSVVTFIHARKTGALIEASVAAGGILGGGDEGRIEALRSYGRNIGLAFQVADDILDIEGDSQALGKGVGGDARKKKLTYPSVLGLERSRKIGSELVEEAVRCLAAFDHRADPLRDLALYIIQRRK